MPQIRLTDLPADLHNRLISEFQHSMVCLGYANRAKHRVTPCGSGTLVKTGNTFGILTAAHVLAELVDKEELTIFLDGGRGLFVLEQETIVSRMSTTDKYDENGPDIAFLKLPTARVATVAAVKSFVNLDIQEERYARGMPELGSGVWCTTGFPAALGKQFEEGENLHTVLYGLVGLGSADRYEIVDRFDYLSVGAQFQADTTLPKTFEGMSGGAIWQVTILNDEGELRVGEKYLGGVMYYQTELRDEVRYIKCHGPKSIYDYALPELIRSIPGHSSESVDEQVSAVRLSK